MTPDTETHPYKQLWDQLKTFVSLNISNARLTAAEKITVLLTAAAVSIAAFVICVIICFFLSVALAHWLAGYISIAWAYVLLSALYLIILLVIFFFRKPLIMNPVARFISRLFLS